MAIYDFCSTVTFTNINPGPRSSEGATDPTPSLMLYPPGLSQQSDIGGRTPIFWEPGRTEPADIQEFIEPGFRYLDEAMKLYFSDIRIPTKDITRFMGVKIAGGDKSVQIWIDDLKHGRALLPIMSINRSAHNYNPMKFSPPYLPLRRTYTNRSRDRMKLSYRPVPYLVDYSMTIWAEHKRDAEYALFQIIPRFNPLAEFRVSDGHMVGNVQIQYKGANDASEKEASAEQLAKIRYEISCTAEAWLSLPEKVVPTILGRIGSIRITDSTLNPAKAPEVDQFGNIQLRLP